MHDRSGPAELPAALTDRVAFLLQLAVGRAQAMGEEALTEIGLTGREYGVLALLEAGAPVAQHRLGAALGIDRTSTVAVFGALESRRLIQRSRAPDDRRAYVVTLTAAGDRLRARAADLLADCDRRFLASLSERQRTDLRITLLRLVE